MSSKKLSFLFSLAALILTSGVDAQQVSSRSGYTGGYDWRDSSLIPATRAAQQNDFMNNLYNFPAKPRNQWEVGVKAGLFNVGGDVASLTPNLGFAAHVRKSIGYSFSLRGEFAHGTGKGLAWQSAGNYRKNTAWNNNGYASNFVDGQGNRNPAKDQVYYNYKTNVNDLSVQGLFSFSNIRFHKARTKMSTYMLAGIGLSWYKTNVNALNGTSKYNFNSITNNPAYADRNDIRKALKDLLDDSYETRAESHGTKKSRIFGDYTSRAVAMVGFGMAFKITNRVNFAIEDRVTFTGDDLIDGQRWQETAFGDASMTRNFDTYNYLTFGLNFNLF
jgi:hypothetical protein